MTQVFWTLSSQTGFAGQLSSVCLSDTMPCGQCTGILPKHWLYLPGRFVREHHFYEGKNRIPWCVFRCRNRTITSCLWEDSLRYDRNSKFKTQTTPCHTIMWQSALGSLTPILGIGNLWGLWRPKGTLPKHSGVSLKSELQRKRTQWCRNVSRQKKCSYNMYMFFEK